MAFATNLHQSQSHGLRVFIVPLHCDHFTISRQRHARYVSRPPRSPIAGHVTGFPVSSANSSKRPGLRFPRLCNSSGCEQPPPHSCVLRDPMFDRPSGFDDLHHPRQGDKVRISLWSPWRTPENRHISFKLDRFMPASRLGEESIFRFTHPSVHAFIHLSDKVCTWLHHSALCFSSPLLGALTERTLASCFFFLLLVWMVREQLPSTSQQTMIRTD